MSDSEEEERAYINGTLHCLHFIKNRIYWRFRLLPRHLSLQSLRIWLEDEIVNVGLLDYRDELVAYFNECSLIYLNK